MTAGASTAHLPRAREMRKADALQAIRDVDGTEHFVSGARQAFVLTGSLPAPIRCPAKDQQVTFVVNAFRALFA